CPAVSFLEWTGADGNLPRRATIQMLHHAHLDRFLLVIPDFDLKRLVERRSSLVDVVGHAPSLAHKVESGPRKRADRLIARRVIDSVFPGKLQPPIRVAAIKSHAALR